VAELRLERAMYDAARKKLGEDPQPRDPVAAGLRFSPASAPPRWTSVVMVAGLLALAILLFAVVAHAQLAVTDPPTEQATAQTASELNQTNQTLAQDVTQNTLTANAVTTAGDTGIWSGQAQYLNSLMDILSSGVSDPQTFASSFPGFVDPGPESIYQAEQFTMKTLNTDAAALGVVQSQAKDFIAQDRTMAQIEACNQAAGMAKSLLYATRCNTEALLFVAQQEQITHLLQMTEITVTAVSNGEVMNEKAQVHAADAVQLNSGVMP
jgi:hypothetical protein